MPICRRSHSRAPGLEPGLLESATTRRAGVVQLSDVAPTVLDLFGLDVPTEMEGRPMRRSGTGGSVDDRVTFLVDTAREAELRDRVNPYASTILTVGVIALAVAYTLACALAAIGATRVADGRHRGAGAGSGDVCQRARARPERPCARRVGARAGAPADRRARGAAPAPPVPSGRGRARDHRRLARDRRVVGRTAAGQHAVRLLDGGRRPLRRAWATSRSDSSRRPRCSWPSPPTRAYRAGADCTSRSRSSWPAS